jgi:hypothetical protein
MASAAFLGGEVCTGRGQLVAGAVNGQDKPRTEAAAEASDVDVDGALIAVIVARPDAIEEVRAREDLAGMACEDLEQTKLARFQIEVAAAEAGGVMRSIDDQVADDDRLRRDCQGADFRRAADAVARTLKHEGRKPDAVESQRIIATVVGIGDRADFIVA